MPEERLIFGAYPELFNVESNDNKIIYLKELMQSYLLKDILAFSGIRHSEKIVGLLRLIAYQVGSEVSYHAFECKFTLNKKIKIPPAFATAYPDALFDVIHRENYLDFIV